MSFACDDVRNAVNGITEGKVQQELRSAKVENKAGAQS